MSSFAPGFKLHFPAFLYAKKFYYWLFDTVTVILLEA